MNSDLIYNVPLIVAAVVYKLLWFQQLHGESVKRVELGSAPLMEPLLSHGV